MYVKVYKVYYSILKCLNKMGTSKNKNLFPGDKKSASCLLPGELLGRR